MCWRLFYSKNPSSFFSVGDRIDNDGMGLVSEGFSKNLLLGFLNTGIRNFLSSPGVSSILICFKVDDIISF